MFSGLLSPVIEKSLFRLCSATGGNESSEFNNLDELWMNLLGIGRATLRSGSSTLARSVTIVALALTRCIEFLAAVQIKEKQQPILEARCQLVAMLAEFGLDHDDPAVERVLAALAALEQPMNNGRGSS
jgi:hypothetical protein